MDEATASSISVSAILTLVVLIGGLMSAFFGFRAERRIVPDYAVLAQTIINRAWNTAQVSIVLGSLLLLYFLASFTGLFFYEEQIPIVQLTVTLLIYGLLIVIITVINRKRQAGWATTMGMGTAQLHKLKLVPLFYLIMMPPLLLLTLGWHGLLELISQSETELQDVAEVISGDLSLLEIAYILMAIFAAPVYEELIFRGIAFPYLARNIGMKQGIVLTSIIFATIHFHLPSIAPLGLLSVGLCLAYWRTGSLWVCIGMHMLFNAVTILALNTGS